MNIKTFIDNFSKETDMEYISSYMNEAIHLSIPLHAVLSITPFSSKITKEIYHNTFSNFISESIFEENQDHLVCNFVDNKICPLDILFLYNKVGRNAFFKHYIYKEIKNKHDRKLFIKHYRNFNF